MLMYKRGVLLYGGWWTREKEWGKNKHFFYDNQIECALCIYVFILFIYLPLRQLQDISSSFLRAEKEEIVFLIGYIKKERVLFSITIINISEEKISIEKHPI